MSNFWITLAIFLALISMPLNSIALLLLAALLVLLVSVTRWWANYCLVRVSYQHELSSYRAFTGDELVLTTELTNNKFLPMPWVQVSAEMSAYAAPKQGHIVIAPDQDRILLNSLMSLGWYHRIVRRYSITCERRGHFYLGPVKIRSGDLFGMFSREMRKERDQTLAVYPKVLPLSFFRLPAKQPYGNVRLQRSLLDDVTRPMGSREYAVGDSFRYIHWKSSARTGNLQTRVFDASTTPNFVLFYGVRTVEPPLQGSLPQLLELGVLTVTALANYALEQGQAVGVYVNQTSRLTSRLLQVPTSSNPDQLTQILEVMAQVHPDVSIPLTQLISDRSKTLPWGATIIAVTAVVDEGTLALLTRMRRAGRSVALVTIGHSGEIPVEGIPTYRVSDASNWQTMGEVLLQ